MDLNLRPSLTAYVRQRLDAFRDGYRHNLAIVGPMASGKSFLLREALDQADARFLKIVCTLQRGTVHEFGRAFAGSILRALASLPETADDDAVLERAARVAPRTTDAALRLGRTGLPHASTELLVSALDLVPLAHQELDRPCILVLDEFLHLGELGLSHAFHELGKRVVTWPFTVFVVTSSSCGQAREILRERLQLLFGQFELLTLGALESTAAVEWMRRELPGAGRREDLVSFLTSWVGSCPWYLDLFLKRMKELVVLGRQESISEHVMSQAGADLLGSASGVLHQWFSARVAQLTRQRHGTLARDVLLAIARGARTSLAIARQGVPRRNLSHALQLLVDQDLVCRKGACWVIPDQVLGFWLASVLGHAAARGDHSDRCRRAFIGTWATWLKSMQLPLAERITELLGQFQNETVSLDHKTGRLPAFRSMTRMAPTAIGQTYIMADGEDQRWCCLVHEGRLEESAVHAFQTFCRSQSPKPSRKVVVAKDGLDLNAKLLAKEANMWVWEPDDMRLLGLLYEQPLV